MKKLIALVTVALLALTIFAVPNALSFIVPEEKTVLYIDPQEKKIPGPCIESTRFDAQIMIYNVKDLYAWDITVHWNPLYLKLEAVEIKVPPGWTAAEWQLLINDTSVPGAWRFSVTRLGLGGGFNGTCSLAKMSFHVIYEPCWAEGCITTDIHFDCYKLSNGCGGIITPDIVEKCDISLNPAKPNMEVLFSDKKPIDLTAKKALGYYKNQVITAYVWVSNATKLYDIKLVLLWNTSLINFDIQQVTINEAAFPMPWAHLDQIFGTYDDGQGNIWDSFDFYIERPYPAKPGLKGDFWILKIDFKVKCVVDGEGLPVNASTPIFLLRGETYTYLSMCGTHYWNPDQLTLSEATYYWRPIRYDFSQNGHVGVEDIKTVLLHYGHPSTCSFNFNGIDGVDIYDVVLVAKAYCNKTPPPMP